MSRGRFLLHRPLLRRSFNFFLIPHLVRVALRRPAESIALGGIAASVREVGSLAVAFVSRRWGGRRGRPVRKREEAILFLSSLLVVS